MDKLDSLLKHSSLTTQVFYAGQMSDSDRQNEATGMGRLHVLYAGHLHLQLRNRPALSISEPSLILFPRPIYCQINPELGNELGVQIVSAHIDFGLAMSATLTPSIPDVLVIPLIQTPQFRTILDLLLEEATHKNCGKRVALNHLMNYFLLLLLRYLMEGDAVKTGILAALTDAKLAIAVTAMHDQPHMNWTLDNLAQAAGMSRSRFANHFRLTTGMTALGYLTIWRLEITKNHLKEGESLKSIAPKVGYSSAEALIRSFSRHTHQTPKDWLKLQTK